MAGTYSTASDARSPGDVPPRLTFLDTGDLGEFSKVNVKCYRVVGSLLESIGLNLLGYRCRDENGQDKIIASIEEHLVFLSERRGHMHI